MWYSKEWKKWIPNTRKFWAQIWMGLSIAVFLWRKTYLSPGLAWMCAHSEWEGDSETSIERDQKPPGPCASPTLPHPLRRPNPTQQNRDTPPNIKKHYPTQPYLPITKNPTLPYPIQLYSTRPKPWPRSHTHPPPTIWQHTAVFCYNPLQSTQPRSAAANRPKAFTKGQKQSIWSTLSNRQNSTIDPTSLLWMCGLSSKRRGWRIRQYLLTSTADETSVKPWCQLPRPPTKRQTNGGAKYMD